MCKRCYISAVTSSQPQPAGDPTEQNHLRPLRDLLTGMDEQIAQVYTERGIRGVRPRFTKALIRLYHRGPLTIKELATQVDVTHSAMSQTLTAMRREGLVETSAGVDARTRTVGLTDKGRALVPFLEAEWRATEAAWEELDAEVPYPLRQVVTDLSEALQRRSFANRVSTLIDRELNSRDAARGRRRRGNPGGEHQDAR